MKLLSVLVTFLSCCAYTKSLKLTVITGISGDDFLDSVEIVDMESDTGECRMLPPYPRTVYGMAAAFFDGEIITCGGHTDDDECYSYDPEEAPNWHTASGLVADEGRYLPAASVIGDTWLVTGDQELPYNIHPEFITIEDGGFDIAPTVLPEPMFRHCQLTINDTHILFVNNDERSAHILNWDNLEWTRLDDLQEERYSPACGLIDSPSNGPEVVISGYGTTEILNLSTLTWRAGPPLPLPHGYAYGYVQDGQGSFLVVGGYDSDQVQALDSILRFDPVEYSWQVLEQRLQVPRYYPTVVAMPDDFVECQ